jgi:hypothetical protein
MSHHCVSYFTGRFLDIRRSEIVHMNSHIRGLPWQAITTRKCQLLLWHSERQKFHSTLYRLSIWHLIGPHVLPAWSKWPRLLSNTFKWTVARCVLQYASVIAVSVWRCSTALYLWSPSVAVIGCIGGGREAPVSWPARSPNFNPYFLCGYLNTMPVQSLLKMNCGMEYN